MALERALIVDDSKTAQEMLGHLIFEHGINVDYASSAEEALRYLDGQKPGIIFMDHVMPGTDGLTATKLIKSDPKTAGIPIIIYTSNEDPYYRQKAMEAGAMTVLAKPPNKEKLLQILTQLEKFQPGFRSRIIEEKHDEHHSDRKGGLVPSSAVPSKPSEGLSIPMSKGPNSALQMQNFWAEVDHRIHEQGKETLKGSVATEVQNFVKNLEGKLQVKIIKEINMQLTSQPQMNTGLKALIESIASDAASKIVDKAVIKSTGIAFEEAVATRLSASEVDNRKDALDIAKKIVDDKAIQLEQQIAELKAEIYDNKSNESSSVDLDGKTRKIDQEVSNVAVQLGILTEEVADLQKHFDSILSQFGENIEISQRFEDLEMGAFKRLRRGFISTRFICYLSALTAGFTLVVCHIL